VRINEELLVRKVAAPVLKTEINGRGVRCADHATLLYPQKLALKFANQRWSLSQYSLLAVLEATEFVFVVVDLMKPRALMPHF
jgi:hypothetical protein